jgi:biotin transport system permease protein
MIGSYAPGDSAVHRLAAGVKLTALAAFALVVAWTGGLAALAAWAVVLGLCWALAGLSVAHLARTLRPIAWFAAAIFVFQVMIAGGLAAVAVVGKLALLVTAAALITLTTRTTDLLAAVTAGLQPVARLGLDPGKVAMAVVFVVRLVPFVATLSREALDAQLARGAARNPLRVGLPLAIRLMRAADVMAEALLARGYGSR